ncbi:MAG TPA: 16S rRNA (guanine(527)-N(7))-methyltransferase RsmG [Methylomirabilota bacterium]
MTDIAGYLARKAHAALGRPLANPELEQAHKYLNLLLKWQKSQRLVGSDEPQWIVDNVIADSLLFRRALPERITTLADVGSGAGVPGVPLAVVLPNVSMTLIEARQKRASFLATVIRELALRNCTLLNDRLENVAMQLAGSFDAVVMRCAGDPTSLLPQIRRILAHGGIVVASGPPRRFDVAAGDWLEIKGSNRPRRFWVHHIT